MAIFNGEHKSMPQMTMYQSCTHGCEISFLSVKVSVDMSEWDIFWDRKKIVGVYKKIN